MITKCVLPAQPILVVDDDDDDIRHVVASFLEDAGCTVAAAPNGKVALEMVERNPPLAIPLDMKMPVMDGWEFARRFRDQPIEPAPIIVMTAAHDAAARAKQLQAVGVLGKPFDLEDLLSIVKRTVRGAA